MSLQEYAKKKIKKTAFSVELNIGSRLSISNTGSKRWKSVKTKYDHQLTAVIPPDINNTWTEKSRA